MRSCLSSFLLSCSLFFVLAGEVRAVGPRNVTTGGTAVKWSGMPVAVHLESDLKVRGKDVSPLIDEALNAWSGIPEASVRFRKNSLGTTVDSSNVCCYFFDSSACPSGPTDDGKNPIVIDREGDITSAFFGASNKFTTLGFASIISFNSSTGAAIKGEAVFNATCLKGVELSGCSAASTGGLSFSEDDFTSFIVHELGHFLGLDHTQVNLTEATDKDSSNDHLITTMFPTFIVGNGGNFKTPEKDDKIGLAQLYPASNFSSSTWTIQGTVFKSDGKTGLQCANLVARNQESDLAKKTDAVSALSGDFAVAGTSDGSYTLPGLTAGATYKIDVEPIGSSFTGASGYTPCRGGSTGEPAPKQFTKQTSTKSFSAVAGSTLTGIDFTVSGLSSLQLLPVALPTLTVPEEYEIDDAIAALEAVSVAAESSCSSSTTTTTNGSSSGGCNLISPPNLPLR